MKKSLFLSAAIAALMIAAPAFAGQPDTDLINLQLNLATIQNGSAHLLQIKVEGDTKVTTAAVGNSMAITVNPAQKHMPEVPQELKSLQINAFAVQDASVSIVGSWLAGALTVDAQAFGNSYALTGGALTGVNAIGQANLFAVQDASVALVGDSIRHAATVSTEAVGNAIDLTTASAGKALLTGQVNAASIQNASIFMAHDFVGGDLSLSAAAVGNNASITLGPLPKK